MSDLVLFNITISAWIWAPALYFVWAMFFIILKKVIFSKLRHLADKSRTKIDDIIMDAMDLPLNLLIFSSGGVLIETISPLDKNDVLTRYFFLGLKVVAVVGIVIFLDNLVKSLIKQYASKSEILRSSGGIAHGIIRILVFGLGFLILLDSFGVSITPLLASLGVGSLAIALALQPTLENFFAGIQIIADNPVKVGQFVKLESGEEGYVHKIGWRSTWIRMLPNNIVVLPNKQLISSKIINYYYPETEMAVLVQVGVHYESDLKKVEKVTIEVGQETMRTVTGGVPEFTPFIRYHTFNAYSIDFTVILRCKEFVDNYLVKHEFVKKLHERYAKEGINIPYPINAINYSQEKAEK